jgi:2-C-methyl-D-erythritol 4-phosphate cytidylyltransferase
MPNEYVIITAGGKGSRMGSDTPKQFMELNGLPVILHTIKAFADYSSNISFVLVLPEDCMDDWAKVVEEFPQNIDYVVCPGGETRFDSVKNGLGMIDGDGMVAIHDAARPLLSVTLISDCFLLAAQKGNAIPVIPLQDSMREISGDESRPVERDKFRLVQTPQVFDVSLIKKAYEQAFRTSFTDDATVAEAFGAKINLLDGEKKNIKITSPEDMLIAKAYLEE